MEISYTPLFDVQRNDDLRGRLLDGSLDAAALIDMDWKDLSTQEQRDKDQKMKVGISPPRSSATRTRR